MKASKLKYMSYKDIAKLIETGSFHRCTLPADRETANAVMRVLWDKAYAAGMVGEPWSAETHMTRVLRVCIVDEQTGAAAYCYAPVSVQYLHSSRPPFISTSHPFTRLLRRMGGLACKQLRNEIRYHVRNERPRCVVEPDPLPLCDRIRQRPLTPEGFRYDRALGVEIEMIAPVEEDTLTKALPFWCRRASDGSIRSEGYFAHEVRALFLRSQMEPRLHKLCNILGTLGCKVNKSCGLHIHLDMRGESEASVTKRARMMDAWLYAMQELVTLSRRTNDYCKWGISTRDRYHAVNLVAFSKYRTLEIRLHSGTVDYTKILAWIRLCELISAMRSKPKAGGCIATLEQLPLAAHDLAYWRARHQQLNPHLYSSGNATSEQE